MVYGIYDIAECANITFTRPSTILTGSTCSCNNGGGPTGSGNAMRPYDFFDFPQNIINLMYVLY